MADFNSSLPVRTEANGDVVVNLVDSAGVNKAAVDASGNVAVAIGAPVTVEQATAANLNATVTGTVFAKLEDGAGTALTSTTDTAKQALDVAVIYGGAQIDPRSIRALTSSDVVTANIKDATGTAFSPTNPLPVSLVDTVGGATEVLDYKTATKGAGTTDTHSYTPTTGKVLTLQKISASASGKIKVEIQIGLTGAEATKVVLFNSTANPNVEYEFRSPQQLADTKTVKVLVTNLDKQAEDVYSSIEGYES